MASVLLEVHCPEHGLERYQVKIIKKYNIRPDDKTLKFRSRPRHEISGIVIGKNVSYRDATNYLMQNLAQGVAMNLVSIRLLK